MSVPSSAPAEGRDSPSNPLLVLLVVVSAIALAGLAVVVRSGPVDADVRASALLTPWNTGVLGSLFEGVNLLGQALLWDTLVIVLGVVLWARGHRTEAVVLVAGLLAAEAGGTAIKILVDRARPPGVIVIDLVTQASYPSGHVTRAAVTVGLSSWLVARRRGRWRRATVALSAAGVFLMGVARIAVGEHWLTDVVGAILFSLAALGLVVLVARHLAGRRPLRSD